MQALLHNDYTQIVYAFIASHQYIFLFFALIIGGETALLPALYLGAKGVLRTEYIAITMIFATIISDTAWYFIGRGISKHSSYLKLSRRTQASVDRLSTFFDKRSKFILFISKFVYGTRTAAQILCGMNRMPFKTYIIVNTLGVLSLIVFYMITMYFIVSVFNMTSYSTTTFQLGLFASVGIIVLLQIIIGTCIKKKWFQRS